MLSGMQSPQLAPNLAFATARFGGVRFSAPATQLFGRLSAKVSPMKNNTGQAQHDIPLRFADGAEGVAVRTGNNAAWLCLCAPNLPLVGYSDAATSESTHSVVRCPQCGREKRVAAPGLKKVPTHVQEVSSVHPDFSSSGRRKHERFACNGVGASSASRGTFKMLFGVIVMSMAQCRGRIPQPFQI
jgi:hypothetical protein